MTSKNGILLAMTAGETPPLGNFWRITAKGPDFYLDTVNSPVDAMPVSLHGPRKSFLDHRVHVKVDRRAAREPQASGHYLEHLVPAQAQTFEGRRAAENAYHVVPLRWRRHLQRGIKPPNGPWLCRPSWLRP